MLFFCKRNRLMSKQLHLVNTRMTINYNEVLGLGIGDLKASLHMHSSTSIRNPPPNNAPWILILKKTHDTLYISSILQRPLPTFCSTMQEFHIGSLFAWWPKKAHTNLSRCAFAKSILNSPPKWYESQVKIPLLKKISGDVYHLSIAHSFHHFT